MEMAIHRSHLGVRIDLRLDVRLLNGSIPERLSPIQDILTAARVLRCKSAFELVGPALPSLLRILVRTLEKLRLPHSLDVHHVGLLRQGLQSPHLGLSARIDSHSLVAQVPLQEIEPLLRVLSHLHHTSLHRL